ncbi:high choriolytic enzyme 1-like [Hippocampus zosterae]|uniref:high choriolytic enzyme 1-like n=1 Tax=Hippocampus zosterae TaxID=109293 RepID=UPI00223E27A9|nr:high choriolytic enzyme 1-like [Hippocampus zosterae]
MSRFASLLMLLLLGLTQAYQDEFVPEQEEEDQIDISDKILTANRGSDEVLVEGDMMVPKTRTAIKCWSQSCVWKKAANGYVPIPYVVSREFPEWEKQMIETAMRSFQESTCIRFVPRSDEFDYVSVENKIGCYSALGKQGGKQVVSINRGSCLYNGIIQHELNHVLGFQHEQNRSDRDRHVRINWENIDPVAALNFNKQDTNNLNTPYDYTSIMHYGRTAFSGNGKDTITPIPDASVRIGHRPGMSKWDITRINMLYSC